MKLRPLAITSVLIMSMISCSQSNNGPKTLIIFAASSTAEMLDELAAEYESESANNVIITLGSSGVLARQIISGAPANIYISAHTQWVDALDSRHLLFPDSKTSLGNNSLILIAHKDNEIISNGPRSLPSLLKGELAIGDPDHVPAGIYAQKALKSSEVWNKLKGKIIPAHDARAVVAYVASQAAEAGIVYKSDLNASDDIRQVFEFKSELHQPITFWISIVSSADEVASQQFIKFIQKDKAQSIIQRYLKKD